MDQREDEHRCANCGSPLPRTGTFCLACDTPVADTTRGLSVGDTQVVEVGRPWRAVAALGVAVILLGAGFWGATATYHRRRDHEVTSAAIKAVRLLVRAESGHASACKYTANTIAGNTAENQAACLRIVDNAPGAHFKHLHAVGLHRHGNRATVALRGRVRDPASGGRPFAMDVKLVESGSSWMLDWDDTPIVHD